MVDPEFSLVDVGKCIFPPYNRPKNRPFRIESLVQGPTPPSGVGALGNPYLLLPFSPAQGFRVTAYCKELRLRLYPTGLPHGTLHRLVLWTTRLASARRSPTLGAPPPPLLCGGKPKSSSKCQPPEIRGPPFWDPPPATAGGSLLRGTDDYAPQG